MPILVYLYILSEHKNLSALQLSLSRAVRKSEYFLVVFFPARQRTRNEFMKIIFASFECHLVARTTSWAVYFLVFSIVAEPHYLGETVVAGAGYYSCEEMLLIFKIPVYTHTL
jgi:hypothetical protein